MRRDWDRRARENARHYVVTGQQQWSDEEFYESGEITMQEDILNDLANICQGRDPKNMAVLEIGCGAGRVTRAFARFFGEVYAVDISAEMVKRARHAVAGYPNAHVLRNNGKDLSVVRPAWWNRLARSAPACSWISHSPRMVFQHIPSREIIESYVREVHRLLRPGGAVQIPGAGRAGEESIREIAGWAPRSRNGKRETWRADAASKCAITAARASNITGSGFSRPEMP